MHKTPASDYRQIPPRALESALATALRRMSSRSVMLDAALSLRLDKTDLVPPAEVGAVLREALPADLIEGIESSSGIGFDVLAPYIAKSLERAVKLAADDLMNVPQTVAAMERLIGTNRVELFSRGLTHT